MVNILKFNPVVEVLSIFWTFVNIPRFDYKLKVLSIFFTLEIFWDSDDSDDSSVSGDFDDFGDSVADCPAMSFVFVCWHSRKWWPPIRGGTLQSALLRLEKVKWSDFVCKKGFAHTNCRWKIKKQDKKWAKTLQKGCFFQPSQLLAQNSWNEGSLMSMSIFPPLWLFFDPKEAYVWTHLNLEWHLLHHLWAACQGPQGSFREPLPCPGVSIPKFNKEQRLTVIFIDHQESNYMY